MSDDIAAFIAARLDEDEATAKAAQSPSPWKAADHEADSWIVTDATGEPLIYDEGTPSLEEAAHIARHDPVRVLREVAAKRAILKEHTSSGGMYPVCSQCVHREPGTWYGDEEDGEEPPDDESSVGYPCPTVRLLGAVYGDHPDYRPGWPTGRKG